VSKSRDIVGEIHAALLEHVRRLNLDEPLVLRRYPQGVLLTYGDLCKLAGDPVIPRGLGRYLTALAHEPKRWDCLVVNQKSGRPSSGYGSDPTFDHAGWEQAVRSVLKV
jgi:hypothetical protein